MSVIAVPLERLDARGLTWVPPLALGFCIALVGAANGGYFATSWGWIALGLAWAVSVTLTLSRSVSPSPHQAAFVALLAGLGAWIWLSAAWADDPAAAVREGLRALTVPLAAAAALVLVRRASAHVLFAGVWAGIVVVAGYGLLTRLAPDRLGVFDPIAGYRLSEPLGYWNALGIFASFGLLLALGLASTRRSPLAHLAAASVPLLALAVYFTFSRGAWIALGLGSAATFALAPRRRALTPALLGAGTPAALAVWLASRSDALTRQEASLEVAARDGRTLLGVLVLAAGAAASLTRILSARPALERAATLVAGLGVAALLAGLVVLFGSPHAWPERAWDAFNAPPPATGGDLNQRLFNLSGSGRVPQWEVALDQAAEAPLAGAGAGSYEAYWLEHRELAGTIRDAHSLYLETYGELGLVGLALLLGALALPVAGAIRHRLHPLVPAAFGAYVAYLAHAGVDWDWELPAVTLTAVVIGAALIVPALEDQRARPMSPRVRYGALGVTLVLMVVAFVGLVGNMALAGSDEAAHDANWQRSIEQAEKAKTWAPWSPEPYRRIGEARLAQGDLGGARESFLLGIRKSPRDWSLWFDLARASIGRDQREALARAGELNPLSPEIRRFHEELGLDAG